MVNNVHWVIAQMKLVIANKFSVCISNYIIQYFWRYTFKVVPFCVSFPKLFVPLVSCSHIHIHEGTTISLPGTQS